ncbi:MAG: hypothetical protein JW940_00490 [Polyangiaceae bacterium]|nr:hypothetical protein [Polyangiaceae bacterium]
MQPSTSELQHELTRLHDEDVQIGFDLNEVERDIVHAERELADAKRRKAQR